MSWVDIAPSILNLAGVAVPTDSEGQVFLGPESTPPREAVFAGLDRMDEIFDRVSIVREPRLHDLRNFSQNFSAPNVDRP